MKDFRNLKKNEIQLIIFFNCHRERKETKFDLSKTSMIISIFPEIVFIFHENVYLRNPSSKAVSSSTPLDGNWEKQHCSKRLLVIAQDIIQNIPEIEGLDESSIN